MECVHQNDVISLFLKKACGSAESVRNYKPRIERFFQHIKVDPDQLVSEWKRVKYDLRERERFLDEWTDKVERYIYNNFQDCTPKTRMNELTIVVSFFKNSVARGIPIEPKREKHTFVKYHNRDIKRKEIRRILEHSSDRDKAFFLMMVESGLRPHTLVNLRYKHIKPDFEMNRVPMMIDLPSELLKGRVEHRWTFIGADGFKALRTYLMQKLRLKNEDLIFTARRKDAPKGVLTRSTFSMIFSHLAMKLRIVEPSTNGKPKKIRLYCLRKFFMDNCRYEGFDHIFKEFWMGHETTQTHYVSRDIERHREEYARCYETLAVRKAIDEHEVLDLRRQLEELRREFRERMRSTIQYESKIFDPIIEALKHVKDPEEKVNLLIKMLGDHMRAHEEERKEKIG